jgi:hypothetical protein
MDDRRSDLVGFGATHQPDDPDFICVLEEGKTIPCFNPSEEEES